MTNLNLTTIKEALVHWTVCAVLGTGIYACLFFLMALDDLLR